MMMLLEQRGQDINITEKIIKAAAMNTHSGKEIMMLLLEQCDQEIKITKKIVEAAAENWYSGKEIMMLLLNNWSSSNANEKQHTNLLSMDHVSVLHAASVFNREDIIEQLIASGVDANTMTDEGGTALHIAVYEGHCSMIQMLLNNKVDLNIKDSHGWTPYMIALTCGRDSICRLLLQYGCEKLDLENTIGFHPSGLIKTVTTSKAIISDHDFIVKTGLSLS